MSNPTAETRAAKDVAPFLKQLRAMLEGEHHMVLRWTTNGRAFEIVDMEQMMNDVLPKYFKHRKYTSFQRQLNYFNFRKWTKSKATVCTFSNEFFRRDQPELAWRITRKKSTHNVASVKQPRLSPSMLPPVSPLRSPGSESTSPPYSIPSTRAIHHADQFAVNVPMTSCTDVLTDGSFPSPTDFAAVLPIHGFPPHAIEPTSMAMPPAELEPFEWIDMQLPFANRSQVETCPLYVYSPMHAAHDGQIPPRAYLYDYVAL